MTVLLEEPAGIDASSVTAPRSNSYTNAVEMTTAAPAGETSGLPVESIEMSLLNAGSQAALMSDKYKSKKVTDSVEHSRLAIKLGFHNIGFDVTVKKFREKPYEKKLIQNITGVALPFELMVIMGPSGSGKTTLLDVISKRVKSGRAEGTISINGQPLDKNFKRIAAFTQQELVLQASLTVTESFQYAAAFRLPNTVSKERKKAIVEELIDNLGLRVCANTKVGNAIIRGISGGQKRRVAIGIELVSNPSLLFLDVPTSGLDSTAAVSLTKLLKELAAGKRTIVMSINQPNSTMFNMFDKILLMSGGRQVFFGPRQNAIEFFNNNGMPLPKNSNPSDFFMDKINVDFPGAADIDAVVAAYKNSQDYAETVKLLPKMHKQEEQERMMSEVSDRNHSTTQKLGEINVFATGFATQLGILLKRNFQDAMRNPLLYWLRVSMYLQLSLVLGTLFLQMGYVGNDIYNRSAVLYFVISFFCFMAVCVGPAAVDDRMVFVRERASGTYRVAAYVLANSINTIPWLMLMSVLSGVGMYFLCDLNQSDNRFGWFILIVFLALYASESIMVLLAAYLEQSIVVIAAGSGIMGLFTLISGYLVLPQNIPGWFIWIYYLNFFTYSLQSILYNEFAGTTFTDVVDSVSGNLTTVAGNDFLANTYDIHSDIRGRNVGILIGMIVFFRIVYWLLLQLKQTGKRK